MSHSKSCLENLSNDLFMEIFDYLYGEHIFFSFFDLNHRFKLLSISYPNLHIDTKNVILSSHIINHIHLVSSKHIQSLKLYHNYEILPIPMAQFSSLRSLTINVSSPILTEEILKQLPSFNHLHHLSINIVCNGGGVTNLITFIFDLPNLHRLELTILSNFRHAIIINRPLLSLRYLFIKSTDLRYFWEIVPFVPNLIHLNLQYNARYFGYIFVPPNCLSKLKRLQLKCAYDTDSIDYILLLCPQVKEIQINCAIGSSQPIKISDNEWEKVLSPLKYLRKKEINVSGAVD